MAFRLEKIPMGQPLPLPLVEMEWAIRRVYQILSTKDIPKDGLWNLTPTELLAKRASLFFLYNCCDRSLVLIQILKEAGYNGDLVVLEFNKGNGEFAYHCGVEVVGKRYENELMFFDPGRNNKVTLGCGNMNDYYAAGEVKQVRRFPFDVIDGTMTPRMVMRWVIGNQRLEIMLGRKCERIAPEKVEEAWETLLGHLGKGDKKVGLQRLQSIQFCVAHNDFEYPEANIF